MSQLSSEISSDAVEIFTRGLILPSGDALVTDRSDVQPDRRGDRDKQIDISLTINDSCPVTNEESFPLRERG